MKKRNYNLNGKAPRPLTGFTLIEIMVAIAVMSIGVVGVYSLVSTVAKASAINSDRFIASELAREGMEIVRNIRDRNWLRWDNWDSDLDACDNGCEIDYNDDAPQPFSDRYLLIDIDGFYNYQSGKASRFKRKVTIIAQPQVLNIEVEIIWRSFDDAEKIYENEEKLYDWR